MSLARLIGIVIALVTGTALTVRDYVESYDAPVTSYEELSAPAQRAVLQEATPAREDAPAADERHQLELRAA